MARGGAYVAGNEDLTAQYYNPAADQSRLGSGHAQLLTREPEGGLSADELDEMEQSLGSLRASTTSRVPCGFRRSVSLTTSDCPTPCSPWAFIRPMRGQDLHRRRRSALHAHRCQDHPVLRRNLGSSPADGLADDWCRPAVEYDLGTAEPGLERLQRRQAGSRRLRGIGPNTDRPALSMKMLDKGKLTGNVGVLILPTSSGPSASV